MGKNELAHEQTKESHCVAVARQKGSRRLHQAEASGGRVEYLQGFVRPWSQLRTAGHRIRADVQDSSVGHGSDFPEVFARVEAVLDEAVLARVARLAVDVGQRAGYILVPAMQSRLRAASGLQPQRGLLYPRHPDRRLVHLLDCAVCHNVGGALGGKLRCLDSRTASPHGHLQSRISYDIGE